MSQKFFSLIHGEPLHIAPATKIIPAKEFSTLLDAGQVLELIKKDAERYRAEVAKEIEQLKELAQRQGFEEGFKLWTEHVAKLEARISQVQKEIEKIVAPLALKAAKKIVGKEISLSEEVIVDIVSTSLKSVSQHKKIVIWVNRKDLEILDKHKARLKSVFEHLETLSLREREDITDGGCVIETEGGIINAQLENKWATLEAAFESLMKQQP